MASSPSIYNTDPDTEGSQRRSGTARRGRELSLYNEAYRAVKEPPSDEPQCEEVHSKTTTANINRSDDKTGSELG